MGIVVESNNRKITTTAETKQPQASSSSNYLELLSQTAAWKNELELNPARVSPTDLQQSFRSSFLVSPPKYPSSSPTRVPSSGGSSCSSSVAFSGSNNSKRTATMPVPMMPVLATTASPKSALKDDGAKHPTDGGTSSDEGSSSLLNDASSRASSCVRRSSNASSRAAFFPPAAVFSRATDFGTAGNSAVQQQQLQQHNLPSVHLTPTPTMSFDSYTMPWISSGPSSAGNATASRSSSGDSLVAAAHPVGQSPNREALVDELVRENTLLRQDLAARQSRVEDLERRVQELQGQVSELRQLPVGKISQIPVA